MKLNRIVIAAGLAGGLMTLATASQSATMLRLACPSAPTNPTCLAATRFAEEAGKLSGGTLDIKVFPSGQLAKGKQAIQQTSAGIIDLVVEDISNYGNFNKDYNVVSWGFAFRDAGHFDRFLHSPVHQKMADALREEHGVRLLATNWRKLPRVVVSKTPVFTPDDVKGLKFRVPGIPSYIKTWETVGANPASVPWGESFQALKTGVVDAMESPFDSVLSQKFHLAAPYVTLTNHVYAAISLAINEAKYQSLGQTERDALAEAASRATAYSVELAEQSAAEVTSRITGDGGYVIAINPAPFSRLLADAADQQEAEGLWSAGLIKAISAIE
ncbi:MAG: TRAP transporter substrate-binding protein [Rhodospirillales bacterium]